ncbi:protein-disulfide isomerase [Halorubrum alkaliphilum]|uniref:Protein-disulfide isomerase n=1 Tax=Halorubrum alkaliphilum TaxID=261290 RepID=A0A8T4GFH4_9EURY|nr:thioredoxin domain-containing protein [Halorubrum alkaliphilum]MBP1922489.1 protein-disulfide isomerase [Halorubrum alkaliphilum]
MNHTRRALLAGVAAGGVVGAAGCLGEDGPDTDDTGEYDCDLDEPVVPDPEFRAVIGDPDADVVVQAYEDFTCPGCAQFKLQQFPAIREEYIDPGTVRYEHWDFPIPSDEEWAYAVASAARGVGVREGGEAFFAFASTIYESQEEYNLEAIGSAAETAGDDPCAAMADALHESARSAIEDDREAGSARGVNATPTVVVNGQAVAEPTAEAVGNAIDAER